MKDLAPFNFPGFTVAKLMANKISVQNIKRSIDLQRATSHFADSSGNSAARLSVEVSSLGERNNELQCRVGGGEADNFHVLQATLAAGGENIVFCDVLLPFGIDDPESSRALH